MQLVREKVWRESRRQKKKQQVRERVEHNVDFKMKLISPEQKKSSGMSGCNLVS